MRLKRVDVYFILVISLIFLFVVLVKFPNVHKDVKLTDWFLVILNAVLAVIATGGFFLAKDWKQTLTEVQARDECNKLKYEYLRRCIDVTYSFYPLGYRLMLPDVFRSDFFDQERALKFYRYMSSIHTQLEDMRVALQEVHASVERLKFWGWMLKPDKLKKYIEVDDLLNDMYLVRFEIDHLINEFFSSKKIIFDGEGDLPKIQFTNDTAEISYATSVLNEFFNEDGVYGEYKLKMDTLLDMRSRTLGLLKDISTQYGSIFDMINPLTH